MARRRGSVSPSEPLPAGDAERIVAECRRCFEAEAPALPPRIHYRMLALLRAMEAAADVRKTFTLAAVLDQVRSLAAGGTDIPDAVARSAEGQARSQGA